MKIGITYNLKSEIDYASPQQLLADDTFEEFDAEETIDSIKDVLEKNGHSVVKLGWGIEAIKRLLYEEIDFVFNMAEGYSTRNRESHMPALLEMLEIPYSGSDALTLSLALDKIQAKGIMRLNNIPTPDYYVLQTQEDIDLLAAKLEYPLFVKPAWQGSSKGIRYNSKVNDRKNLTERFKNLIKNYPGEPVLVEQFIHGREFSVGVLGNKDPKAVGIMQISPKAGDYRQFFYSLEIKRDYKRKAAYTCPPDIGPLLKKNIEELASKTFRVFGCRDVARIDLRVDDSDNIYVLELNPLPGLSGEYSDIIIMARKMGWTYEGFITAILNHAISRYNINTKVFSNEEV